MQALVYERHGVIELQEVADPEPAPDEEVVDVAVVGICGSEIEGFANRSPMRVPPLVMGHEISGVRRSDGARVAVNPLVSCSTCDLCLRGQVNLCRRRSIIGIHRAGGFAERVVVPARNLHPIPDGVAFEQAAFVEPLANAVHAYRLALQADPQPRRVGIIGGGALGVATTMVASARGASEIVVADLNPDRFDDARRAGATSVGRTLDGEFDVIVDAVGAGATRRASVELLRPGGIAVWIGLHDAEPGFDPLAQVRGEKRITGTFCYEPRDFALAVSMSGSVDVGLIDRRPLAEGSRAFLGLVAAPGTHVKTVLVP